MRSRLLAVVCGFAGLPALCAPPEAPPRVAVIRLPDAIAGTKQARKEMEDLAATIGKRQEELKKELAEVDEMKARLADTSNLLNGSAKEDLTREVGLKSGRLQRELEDLQWDSEQREARIYRDIGARMLSVIADFAKKNNFVLVLNASEPSASITFASPVVNITGRIVQQYDLAYPVEPKPAGAAQTPSSKATANPNYPPRGHLRRSVRCFRKPLC